ncbi:unnamed protein product [Pararhodospirillum photometricum DSM 122]|uniref:Uncharacterized protein n=1 Tax=Pararhodospirillum photometricum DSM 122 TaxID=1150469 RepID=H6SR14_PARPM|nr:unnamed protein product [Pararhodospirillum photometricum DSM 122]
MSSSKKALDSGTPGSPASLTAQRPGHRQGLRRFRYVMHTHKMGPLGLSGQGNGQ